MLPFLMVWELITLIYTQSGCQEACTKHWDIYMGKLATG